MSKGKIAAIGIIVALVAALSCVFIVDERKQALVLAFGKVDRVITEPGLKFKLPPPFNTVTFYEKRILPLETDEVQFLPRDRKRRAAAAFIRWRIEDPVKFRESVADEEAALLPLRNILEDSLGKVLGSESSDAVLSDSRESILEEVKKISQDRAKGIGVEIVDVRIRTWFLPNETLEATYERMRSDRNRIARDAIARGEEQARRIRAAAEREAVGIVAEARRESEKTKGLADAKRNKIFADAYQRDEEFFAFQRSLKAYENALKGKNSTMVLSPNSDFFEYLRDENGASSGPPGRSGPRVELQQ